VAAEAGPGETSPQQWFSRGVAGIGTASLLADLGHEIPTALLPSLLTVTLHAPASALGLIEGISDAANGVAQFTGGVLADDPGRRRRIAVGGYTTTAVLSAAIGAAAAPWQAGILRASAWAARGLRVPARNALLADIVPPGVYGRAYGFERAMDNLGAIGGPLLAIGLVALAAVRAAIGLSVIPGALAALAIIYAIRHTAATRQRTTQPIRIHIRPVLRGHLGRLMIGVTAFELGNAAATLLILRATDLFDSGRSQNAATQLALVLYVLYNLAATLISIPAGRHGDRYNPIRVLAAGAIFFAAGYGVFAAGPRQPWLLAAGFILAGLGIGCGETAESAAVAALAPAALRGSAFGLLATAQAGANLAASALAGIIWTAVSPGRRVPLPHRRDDHRHTPRPGQQARRRTRPTVISCVTTATVTDAAAVAHRRRDHQPTHPP
jgi:MFS family permease